MQISIKFKYIFEVTESFNDIIIDYILFLILVLTVSSRGVLENLSTLYSRMHITTSKDNK